MDTIENQNKFNGWARVEINGHNTHIGFVTTQVFGQAVLFRIDQPEIPEDEKVSIRDDWSTGRLIPKGTTIKRGAIPAASVLVGAGSIYRITPCTEAAALKAIEQSVTRPLIPVGLPDEPTALPEPEDRVFTCCGGNPEYGHKDSCLHESDDESDDCGDIADQPMQFYAPGDQI